MHQHIKANDRIDIIYFDFSKAFDQVDHGILASKLAEISMPFLLLKTVVNFISDRSYTLKINGIVYQNTFTTPSSPSVPQGPHCGPLPFFIMCRDIVNCVANTNVKLLSYADDTKFFKIVNNNINRKNLQLSIDKMASWSQTNKLNLNGLKTYHVSFSQKRDSLLMVNANHIVHTSTWKNQFTQKKKKN